MRSSILMVAMLLSLGGCGGGSLSDAGTPIICPTCPPPNSAAGPPGTVEGYWRGSGGGYDFGAVVLGDGSTFTAYSRGGVIEGLMVGKTSASNETFAGSVTDFNGARLLVTSGTLQGTYSTGGTMSATASLGSLNIPFTATYDPSYDTPIDLASLAGAWSGSAASKGGITTGNLTVSTSGTFTGSTPFCTVSGSLGPAQPGKNPLAVVAAFSGSSCPLAGRTVTGLGIVAEVSGVKQMMAAGVLADGTDGFFSLLTKR